VAPKGDERLSHPRKAGFGFSPKGGKPGLREKARRFFQQARRGNKRWQKRNPENEANPLKGGGPKGKKPKVSSLFQRNSTASVVVVVVREYLAC